ncbi:Fc receptor-like protein 4 [Xenopus laevis]|uniref:Fc receptor-like protein 4 n=1 Tax=Xenopus laevis TaxID=8355 RepID=A0A8J1LKL8_XENLA|nr:Fc receptor-like protein 4 [Xenopus laevis]
MFQSFVLLFHFMTFTGSTMSALALITLISLYAKYIGATVRPVISLSPNWATIFKGESVNLTCNVDSDVQENQYSWYKNGQQIHSARTITIQAARETNNGNYQCQTGASEKSDAIRLVVKNDDIMLQAPPRINEGDVLNLRCHSRRTKGAIATIFFYEDEIVQPPVADSVFHVGKVRRNVAGTYRCAKKFDDTLLFAEEFISVRGKSTCEMLWGNVIKFANRKNYTQIRIRECHNVIFFFRL